MSCPVGGCSEFLSGCDVSPGSPYSGTPSGILCDGMPAVSFCVLLSVSSLFEAGLVLFSSAFCGCCFWLSILWVLLVRVCSLGIAVY